MAVDVRDLEYRWGSCRTLDGPRTINIHWATLQLRPTLVDDVLDHELAHLREPNHTSAFWDAVGRVLPQHSELKAALATAGSSLWLGPVA